MTGNGEMPASMTASDIVVQQIKQFRKQRHLTAEGLSQRCIELGAEELTANVVWNIESGRREIALDTFLVLALALDVPPIALLLPVNRPEAVVDLTAAVRVERARLAAWITGKTALPGTDKAAFTAAASQLPDGGRASADAVDVDARAKWWAAQVNAYADDVAQQVAEQVRTYATQFADQFAAYADTEPDGSQAPAVLQRLRARLDIDTTRNDEEPGTA